MTQLTLLFRIDREKSGVYKYTHKSFLPYANHFHGRAFSAKHAFESTCRFFIQQCDLPELLAACGIILLDYWSIPIALVNCDNYISQEARHISISPHILSQNVCRYRDEGFAMQKWARLGPRAATELIRLLSLTSG